MKTETALADAFRANGLHARDVEFDIALAKYLNSGGTIPGALARVNVAAGRMSGEGPPPSASNRGRDALAQTRQQVEGRDVIATVPQGQKGVASLPSFNRGGGDRLGDASSRHLAPVVPAREPTQQQRAALAVARNVTAITIMDTLKIDGRSIGNWTVGEARKAGQLKTREGYILIEAARVVANANGNELLRHLVKPREMQKIIQKAAEVADAV